VQRATAVPSRLSCRQTFGAIDPQVLVVHALQLRQQPGIALGSRGQQRRIALARRMAPVRRRATCSARQIDSTPCRARCSSMKAFTSCPLVMAVELRLGEIRAGQLQDLVGLAQLADLALQFLDALLLGRRRAWPYAAVALALAHSLAQRLGLG
jgi:hypothetical protein